MRYKKKVFGYCYQAPSFFIVMKSYFIAGIFVLCSRKLELASRQLEATRSTSEDKKSSLINSLLLFVQEVFSKRKLDYLSNTVFKGTLNQTWSCLFVHAMFTSALNGRTSKGMKTVKIRCERYVNLLGKKRQFDRYFQHIAFSRSMS